MAKVESGEVSIADNAPGKIDIGGILAPEFGAEINRPFAEHMAADSVARYAEKFLGAELRLGFIGLWVSLPGQVHASHGSCCNAAL